MGKGNDDRAAILRRAEEVVEGPEVAKARRMLRGDTAPADAEEARQYLHDWDRYLRLAREELWLEEEQRAASNSRATRSLQHRARAAELRSIRTKLRSSADGHAHKAASLLAGHEGERLPDETRPGHHL